MSQIFQPTNSNPVIYIQNCASLPEQCRPGTFDRDQTINRDQYTKGSGTGAALQSSGWVFIVLVFRLAVGHCLLLNPAFSSPAWNRSVYKTVVGELPEKTLGILDRKLLTVRIGMPFFSSCILAITSSIWTIERKTHMRLN